MSDDLPDRQTVKEALGDFDKWVDDDRYTLNFNSIEVLSEAARAYVNLKLIPGEPDYGAAFDAARDEIGLPFAASVQDYVSPASVGKEREQQLAALRAADEEADARNRQAVKAIVDAAQAYVNPQITDEMVERAVEGWLDVPPDHPSIESIHRNKARAALEAALT